MCSLLPERPHVAGRPNSWWVQGTEPMFSDISIVSLVGKLFSGETNPEFGQGSNPHFRDATRAVFPPWDWYLEVLWRGSPLRARSIGVNEAHRKVMTKVRGAGVLRMVVAKCCVAGSVELVQSAAHPSWIWGVSACGFLLLPNEEIGGTVALRARAITTSVRVLGRAGFPSPDNPSRAAPNPALLRKLRPFPPQRFIRELPMLGCIWRRTVCWLRPAVFCLKRTIYGDERSDQEALEVPAGERDEIRRLISIYLATIHSLVQCHSSIVSAVRTDPDANIAYNNIIVPPQAMHPFELAYQFSFFHTPDSIDEDLVLELIRSIICGFLVISHATALATHEPTDYADCRIRYSLGGWNSDISERVAVPAGNMPNKNLAAAHHIPAPSVSWLNVVMHGENVYGFIGDEDTVFKVIMRGKVAYLYRYSLDLRKNAVNRHFIGDGPSKIPEFPFAEGDRTKYNSSGISHRPVSCIPAMDAALSANGFTGNRTVYFYVALAEIVLRHLDFFAASRRDTVEYAHTEDGLLEYVMKIVHPFAHVLSLCIPEGSMSLAELPIGRAEELHRFIIEFIVQCVHARSPREGPAHIYDLRTAVAIGIRTVYVHRVGEETADVGEVCAKKDRGDLDVVIGPPEEPAAPPERTQARTQPGCNIETAPDTFHVFCPGILSAIPALASAQLAENTHVNLNIKQHNTVCDTPITMWALLEGVLGGDNGTLGKHGWRTARADVSLRWGFENEEREPRLRAASGGVECLKTSFELIDWGKYWGESTGGCEYRECTGRKAFILFCCHTATRSHYLLCGEVPAEYEQFEGFVGNPSGYVVSSWFGAWIGAKEQPRFMSRPEMDGFSCELSDGVQNGRQIGANEPETPERRCFLL
ncbi:hypothetical protein DFH09DRAFT_1096251 [Mycena vulgaris]|nr:hypothetical protein DFH09DRAFT_1096251 [Mycena vulgaris]